MKPTITDTVSIYLLKKGYTVKSFTRTCFDILARDQDRILLIKILEDANSISEEFTEQMQRISSSLSASPLIIAEKAGRKLEDNIVYLRFGIFTLNFTTLQNSVENKFPFIQANPAGITAQIVGNRLKEKREELGYSLNSLAKKIGVSRKMVQHYEYGKKQITVTKAIKMYNLFGPGIFDRINIFAHKKHIFHDISTDITKKFSNLGFETLSTKKVPFDIIAKKDRELILTEIGDKKPDKLHSISQLLDADKLVIFKKKKPKDIPSMTKEEFLEFEKAKELIKFLKEF